MGTDAALLLVAPGGAGYDAIERLLNASFSVTRIRACDVDAAAINQAVRFYVVCEPLTSAHPAVLENLRAQVENHDAVLVLHHQGLRYGEDGDFFSFVGAEYAGQEVSAPETVRIYPHYLTANLPETAPLRRQTAPTRLYRPFGRNDNVFISTMRGEALAFETVHGRKGRVIGLMLGGADDLSEVEQAVYRNLASLLLTAEDMDTHFAAGIRDRIPLRVGAVSEPHNEVGRWNTLACAGGEDSIYAHSSHFLPACPEFFCEKTRLWNDGNDFTPERLRRGLASVEMQTTDFCTQDCHYCYNRRSMEIGRDRTRLADATHRELEEDLLALRREGARFAVRYTGSGEPLCHPRTLPSLFRFERTGLPCILVTNGSELSEEQAAALGKEATYVRVSIDAARSDSYARIRRCDENAFGRLLSRIRAMAGGRALLGATFLVGRENFREIHDFCAMMKGLGVHIVWMRSTDSLPPFSPGEMADIQHSLAQASVLCDDSFHVFGEQFQIFRKVSALHYRYDDADCWAARTKAVVRSNGDVVVCLSRPDFVLGNLHKQRFSEIWSGAEHLRLLQTQDFRRCSQCIESRYNHGLEFFSRHRDHPLHKATRTLALEA